MSSNDEDFLDSDASETLAPGGGDRNVSQETLGPYGIVRVLGRGAMGIVYEAVDSHLDRTVAIKTLPTEFARDGDRISRFKREATLLASFSHPHIATVYSHEEIEGQHCLVMEYVEGQGLDEVIAEGRLTSSEILQIALQVSTALEVAHNHGVVHRDLKPANIRLTSSFVVKVLDFGLAKNVRIGGSGSSVDQAAQTAAGQVLGTPSYMSPEQARGRTVDKRADLWAIGCILFEMLCGRRVFGGDNISDTLVNVLQQEPDWTLLPSEIPGPLVKILERCLQKDVDARLPDAGMIRIELEELINGKSTLTSASVIGPTIFQKSNYQKPVMLAVGLVAAMIGLLSGWLIQGGNSAERMNDRPLDVVRPFYASIELQAPVSLGTESKARYRTCFAVSPDGQTIVYSTGRRTDPMVVRKTDGFSHSTLPGTEGAHSPFFSPDNKQIAFVLGEKLCVVHVDGGNVRTLADAEEGSAGAWQDDGFIYYPTTEASTLWRISETGGTREELYATTWCGCNNPSGLSDGRLLFTRKGKSIHDDYSETVIFDPQDRSEVSLGLLGMRVRYCESGYLVYSRDGGLFARAFDLATTTLSGNEIMITSRVVSNGYSGSAHFDVAENGTIMFLEGQRMDEGYLAIVGSDGEVKERLENFPSGRFGRFELSPDERYLALARVAERDDIWIYDMLEKTIRKVTTEGFNYFPFWSPDGEEIYYGATMNNASGLYKMSVMGSQREKLFNVKGWYVKVAIGSSKETMLLESEFAITDVSGRTDMEGLKFENESVNWGPMISPDDQWVLFVSDRTGRYEIYVAPLPFVAENARQVSFDGGHHPTWSHDGKKIYYHYINKFFEVNVGEDIAESLPAPTELFEHEWVVVPGGNYKPFGTEGEFIAIEPVEANVPITTLKVIQNALPSLPEEN